GPLVLAAKTDTAQMLGLLADDSRGGHIAKADQVSLTEIPHSVVSNANLAEQVAIISPQGLRFRLKNLQVRTEATEMQLMPFYKLYDGSYIINWPKLNSSSDFAERHVIYERSDHRRKLNASTVNRGH